MTTICTICARGGSVGLPGKNIRPLLGKPLIAYSIEQAKSCSFIDHIFVSTDSPQIAEVACSYGAIVLSLRSPELAKADTPKLDALNSLVHEIVASGITPKTIIDLDPTSPLRTLQDIENAYHLLTDDVDVVLTGYHSEKNPYFNMIEYGPDGSLRLCKKMPGITSRQSAPQVYSMNASIYIWHKSTLSKGLWGGRSKLYLMPRERSIDIDTQFDFDLVENLLCTSLKS